MDKAADDQEFQRSEVNRAVAERVHDAHRARSLHFAQATVRSGDSAVKNAILINGGALIAILTFIGNVGSKNPGSCTLARNDARWFGACMLIYALALLLAAATYCTSWQVNNAWGASYDTMNFMYEPPYLQTTDRSDFFEQKGKFYVRISLTILTLSYMLFAIASALCGAALVR